MSFLGESAHSISNKTTTTASCRQGESPVAKACHKRMPYRAPWRYTMPTYNQAAR